MNLSLYIYIYIYFAVAAVECSFHRLSLASFAEWALSFGHRLTFIHLLATSPHPSSTLFFLPSEKRRQRVSLFSACGERTIHSLIPRFASVETDATELRENLEILYGETVQLSFRRLDNDEEEEEERQELADLPRHSLHTDKFNTFKDIYMIYRLGKEKKKTPKTKQAKHGLLLS